LETFAYFLYHIATMNINKISWIILIVAILSLAIWVLQKEDKNTGLEDRNIRVGAILPMTGAGAIFGENLRNAMELALEDVREEGIEIEVFYEDSEADPVAGLAAYRRLVDILDVDVVFVAFTRVALPLVPLIENDDVALIMTVVAGTDAPLGSDLAFRYFATAKQYAGAHFEGLLTGENYDSISIVYVNDDYGVSIFEELQKNVLGANISIVTEEAYTPGTTDYRSFLTKVKASNAEAFAFITSTPPETMNILKQAHEIGIEADIFEPSMLLSIGSIRENLGAIVEGVHTITFPFILGQSGKDLFSRYADKYVNDPMYSAPFGYDMIKLVAEVSNGKAMGGREFAKKTLKLGEIQSLNGPVVVGPTGEINPPIIPVFVSGGDLIEVK